MTVDRLTSSILSSSVSQNIPSPEEGIVKTVLSDGIEIRIIRGGIPLGQNSAVMIEWAACALREGDYIASVSVERDDLRIISRMTGTSLKTLEKEYGVRGYLLCPRVVLYGEGKAENLGTVSLPCGEEDIRSYLLETILDMLGEAEEWDE